jgi:hypothetical protein
VRAEDVEVVITPEGGIEAAILENNKFEEVVMVEDLGPAIVCCVQDVILKVIFIRGG